MKRITHIVWSMLLVLVLAGSVHGRDYYHTYDVVEVTETTIVLERQKRGETERVALERSRRPETKKGDKVRYDKTRDRLREVKYRVTPE